jgi:hypothetical protein
MSAPEVVRYRTNSGVHTALIVERGRKWMKIIPMEDRTVRVQRVTLDQERYMRPLLDKNDSPYPWRKAVRLFIKHADRGYGITKTAKAFLKPRRH